PGFEAVNASNFVGFPDFVGRALRLTPINAACPGEASGSFLDTFAEDSGCRDYRAQAPLHAAYAGTQEAFAVEFVKANRSTRLVTIQLGANDLFQLRDRCFGVPSCIAAILPFTLAILEQNILTTIADLRAAGYRRPIVLVNYFPLDLRDTQTTALIQALNAAIADAAGRRRGRRHLHGIRRRRPGAGGPRQPVPCRPAEGESVDCGRVRRAPEPVGSAAHRRGRRGVRAQGHRRSLRRDLAVVDAEPLEHLREPLPGEPELRGGELARPAGARQRRPQVAAVEVHARLVEPHDAAEAGAADVRRQLRGGHASAPGSVHGERRDHVLQLAHVAG